MEYVKLWTTFHDDPSIQNLSPKAIVYYVNALSWCGRHETQGMFTCIGKAPVYVKELVTAGKFIPQGDGRFLIHGWDGRQVSAIDLEELREKRREAGRRGGVRSGEARRQANASSKDEPNRQHLVPAIEATVEAEVEVEVEELPAPRPRREAKRDELFEAVCRACRIDWTELTDTARGPLNRAVAQLRGVGATPAEVTLRATRWPYDDDKLTPSGLAKHWPALGGSTLPPDLPTATEVLAS